MTTSPSDLLTPIERRVADAMGRYGAKLTIDQVTPDTAMAQDAWIDGIDVDDFVADLHGEFGAIIYDIPWLDFSDQRASFRGWAIALLPFWLIGRLVRRPAGESLLAAPGEVSRPRLTVGHIAAVIEKGGWFEPADMTPAFRKPLDV